MKQPAEKKWRMPSHLSGLSGRLVLLTIVFVLLAEFLIWTPSVSRYRRDYLLEHISRAHLAMVAVSALKPGLVDDNLEQELLFYTGTYGIAINDKSQRLIIVGDTMPDKIDLEIDLSNDTFMGWISDAFDTLAQSENRVLRVTGMSPNNADIIAEIIIDEAPMRQQMVDFSWRIMGLSIVISLFTAGLVFFSLQWLMVRPIKRITRSLISFRQQPEEKSRVIASNDRTDELGIAQNELRYMQEDIRRSLQQKSRLATLGSAVARVNHDLRNTLATAVLASDRLALVDDPEVQQVMPRLYTAIDRAIRLCSQTLDFVSFSDLKLNRELFHLHELIVEVNAALRETGLFSATESNQDTGPTIIWHNEVPFDISIMADRHQLFRVFHNISLNAKLAGAENFTVRAVCIDDILRIDLIDDGPGLPENAQENLFESFAGSSRTGGTGLGLVIARDIVGIHEGNLELLHTGQTGTTFRITLPIGNTPQDG